MKNCTCDLLSGTGRGLFGGDDRVVYWKCEAGQTLKESIHVPITNKVKERALLMAAQQVKDQHTSVTFKSIFAIFQLL